MLKKTNKSSLWTPLIIKIKTESIHFIIFNNFMIEKKINIEFRKISQVAGFQNQFLFHYKLVNRDGIF